MESKFLSTKMDWNENLTFCFPIFRSSFSEFAQKYGKDDRFRIIEKIRERESLFNEFIVEIRKKEKDDKIHKKEQVSQISCFPEKQFFFFKKKIRFLSIND